MTATAITQEQLLFFKQLNQGMFVAAGLVGNVELQIFLDRIKKMHPADSDEGRTYRASMQKTTGIIARIGDDGAYPDGTTEGFESISTYEQLSTLHEEGGKYDLIRRNRGKLEAFIGSIQLTPEGKAEATNRFLFGGYWEVIRATMSAAMFTYVLDDLSDFIKGADGVSIYGGPDKVVYDGTGGGALFAFNNIETGTFDKTMLKKIRTNLSKQTDQDGNTLRRTKVDFYITGLSNADDLRELVYPEVMQDVTLRSVDDWDGKKAIIIGLPDGTGQFPTDEVYGISGSFGGMFLKETDQPEFYDGTDIDANWRWHISWIYTFGWFSRTGIVQYTFTS